MNCYFDGSIGGQSDEWLALGGFVATDRTWSKFQREWQLMLQNRDPVAPYVHMTNLLTGNEPFTKASGWTKDKAERLLWDAAQVLTSMDQTEVCGVACAVDTHGAKRLVREGYAVTKPAVICAEIGLGHLLSWYIGRHKFELAHVFYDQNEPFIKSIRTRWLREERKKIKQVFWGSIARVEALNMRQTPAIQAADILAWAFVRRLRNDPDDDWAALATKLIGERGQPGVLTATQLDPITEEIMRTKYPKRK